MMMNQSVTGQQGGAEREIAAVAARLRQMVAEGIEGARCTQVEDELGDLADRLDRITGGAA